MKYLSDGISDPVGTLQPELAGTLVLEFFSNNCFEIHNDSKLFSLKNKPLPIFFSSYSI